MHWRSQEFISMETDYVMTWFATLATPLVPRAIGSAEHRLVQTPHVQRG